MQQLDTTMERTTRSVHRGYVIDARGWRDPIDGWVARADVTLRGRPVILEKNNRTCHTCGS
jgi:hypothetical protein